MIDDDDDDDNDVTFTVTHTTEIRHQDTRCAIILHENVIMNTDKKIININVKKLISL